MPRGNDYEQVRAENVGKFGDYASAEELIRYQAALTDPALQKALNTPLNEEETAKVRADIPAYAGRFDLASGEALIDAAVRGNALIGVIDNAGRLTKRVVGYTDDWQPDLTPAERRQADAAKEIRAADDEIARIRSQADQEVERARAQAEAEVAEQKALIRRQADEAIAAAAGEEPEPAETTEEPDPEKAPDVAALKGDELDTLAVELGIVGYKKSATVADRRKAIVKYLGGKK